MLVFPGVKVRPGSDTDPSPPSSTVVKNRVELYPLLSLGAFVACDRVKLPTSLYCTVLRKGDIVFSIASRLCLDVPGLNPGS